MCDGSCGHESVVGLSAVSLNRRHIETARIENESRGKHKIPPLRFAPVGMTGLCFLGLAIDWTIALACFGVAVPGFLVRCFK